MSALAYLDAALDGDFGEALEGGSDLRDEMSALAGSVTWPRVRRLIELGVPARLVGELNGAGDIGFARVSLANGGRFFEPVGPDPRLLVAVREQGVLVDIVALHTEQPDDWALRRGAGWCLGHDAWQACEAGRAHSLRIHATPLAWLLSGGDGCCPLDWDAALPLLRGLGEGVLLRCDRGAGQKLEALLRRGGLPRVKEVAPPVERRAA